MTEKNYISIPRAVALGVGSMVGAGIFALMGEAAAIAGSAVWFSFLIAGLITALTAYSFVQLGIRYPSRGGVVEYLVQSYGTGRFSGSCSILFYIAQLIGVSMLSLAFGRYFAKLLAINSDLIFWERILASSLILILTTLKLIDLNFIRKLQGVVVLVNLCVLAAFTITVSTYGQIELITTEYWPEITPILGSIALTFFAFTGFAVVCNTAENMRDPSHDLPRAMFLTITIVMILYITLALAITSVVEAEILSESGAMLLAKAAHSLFGEVGFKILLISAVISTVTCINGGLFGITSITFTLAENGQLPSKFKREFHASTRGLTISAAITLILINFMTLTTVASIGSATSLMVYMLVNFGAFKLIKQNTVSRIIILLSVIACLLAIIVWVVYSIKTSPSSLFVFILFMVIAFVTESLLQKFNGRQIKTQD